MVVLLTMYFKYITKLTFLLHSQKLFLIIFSVILFASITTLKSLAKQSRPLHLIAPETGEGWKQTRQSSQEMPS